MYKDVSIMEQAVLESTFESSNTQSTNTRGNIGSSSMQPSNHRLHEPGKPKMPTTNQISTPNMTDSSSTPPQSRRRESSVVESVQKSSAAGTSKASITVGSPTKVNRHRRETLRTTGSATQESENVEE